MKKYIVEIDEDGNRFYRDADTELVHREDGPAIEAANAKE